MREYIFCVPDENQPIAGDSSVYYPDERDEPMCVREEIVRCKSCKYYDQNDAPSDVYPDRYWCDRMTLYMPTDGFCSFGKQKVVCE